MIPGNTTFSEVCNFGQSQIEILQRENNRNRSFMNMVIHDMRNPTVSIKTGL